MKEIEAAHSRGEHGWLDVLDCGFCARRARRAARAQARETAHNERIRAAHQREYQAWLKTPAGIADTIATAAWISQGRDTSREPVTV